MINIVNDVSVLTNIPSNDLNEEILSAIKYRKNILDLKLESSLSQKIEQTYRDLF